MNGPGPTRCASCVEPIQENAGTLIVRDLSGQFHRGDVVCHSCWFDADTSGIVIGEDCSECGVPLAFEELGPDWDGTAPERMCAPCRVELAAETAEALDDLLTILGDDNAS